MTTNPKRTSPSEQGAALVVVMMLLAALFAAGAAILYLQLMSTRGSGYMKRQRDALFCAESGLIDQRQVVANYYGEQWVSLIDADPGNDPTPYPFTGDIDGDGVADYEVRIEDNDDGDDDFNADNDFKVFIISRCVKYNDTVREVLELVSWDGLATDYRDQAGHGGQNAGNVN